MPQVPELDQVADARRKLASHALYPGWYWALYAPLAVLIVGLPLWLSFLPPALWTPASWVPAGAVVALAVADRLRRRRSGVRLRRRISAYPSARPVWMATILAGCAGYVGIYALVRPGHRAAAVVLVLAVAGVVVAGTMAMRSRMRADIAAGRVVP